MFTIDRILYSTDFSSFSNAAYFHAIALAEHHEAELTICHCHTPGDGHGREYWREQLEQIRPANAEIIIHHVLLEGDPATEIVRFAAEENMNLVVMGTHGRTGVDRLLMGSTAEKVLREAPCSVLVIKLPRGVPAPRRKRLEALTV